jgi:DNA-binding NarL/FixJ family response regulator
MHNPPFISIVDDSAIARHYLRIILSSSDIAISFEAENGKDCIDKMAATLHVPDLIILDIEMPVMSGFEALLILKDRWPATKIIAYSGLDDQKEIERIIEAGADHFISKNSDSPVLITAIREMLCMTVP